MEQTSLFQDNPEYEAFAPWFFHAQNHKQLGKQKGNSIMVIVIDLNDLDIERLISVTMHDGNKLDVEGMNKRSEKVEYRLKEERVHVYGNDN